MAGPTPNPVLRARFETALRLVSPLLDLMLAVGDRVSRLLESDDPGEAPARMAYDGESVPRGLRPRDPRTQAPRG